MYTKEEGPTFFNKEKKVNIIVVPSGDINYPEFDSRIGSVVTRQETCPPNEILTVPEQHADAIRKKLMEHKNILMVDGQKTAAREEKAPTEEGEMNIFDLISSGALNYIS